MNLDRPLKSKIFAHPCLDELIGAGFVNIEKLRLSNLSLN